MDIDRVDARKRVLMHTEHLGSCLCGAVRFKVVGAFERFYLCHCSHCRKDTGSAHAANLFSSRARLVWLSGEAEVSTFTLPQARHTRSFCSVCGSGLPHASPGLVVVPAGSLDTPPSVIPDAHIFTASRAAWDHKLELAPGFETFPS
jgi:hypothetical protein